MAYYPDLVQVLKNIPLFMDLKEFQLAKLAETASILEFEAGSTIISEGGILDCIYIILEGEIKVEVFVPAYGNIETSHLGPLDILGWSALTPVVRQRTGTATSISNCFLVKFESKKLIPLCDLDRDIGVIIYKRIANVAARSFLTTRLQLMNLIFTAAQSHKPTPDSE
jgi:CRP/FNR family cyclic AMP-dependent transcriptional regulator